MFKHVEPYPGDPILTLNEQFGADTRPGKVNLSIGVYLTEAGKLPAMRSVLAAEATLAQAVGPRPYLPMEGSAVYRHAVRELTFGREFAGMDRIATAQTLGGSGALKVGADFIARYFPQARVWASDPTWDNHHSIFAGAGLAVEKYPYYNPATSQVDFSGMLAALDALPAGDVVLLHACCHNPTGADLSDEQWRELAQLVKRRGLLPFFDMAYQGFGRGVEEDAFAIRHFAQQGIALFAATSFSKNFSLYGERCGSLSIVCGDAEQAGNVLGQLKATIRRNYSSPPTHGARIIERILTEPALRADWELELAAMRERVSTMRTSLYDALCEARPVDDFSFLLKQAGMFSYTGLSPDQVAKLRETFGVYLVGTGRMCLAALTKDTVQVVSRAIAGIL
jgi:aromatic-amino-acid transaminase